MHRQTYIQTCMHRHVYTDMYAQTCMHRHVCTDMYEQTCMYRHVCTDMYAHTCMYRHVCTDMYAQTCMHKQTCLCSWTLSLPAPTCSDGMNASTRGSRLAVLPHAVHEQTNRVRLEVNITVKCQQKRVLCLWKINHTHWYPNETQTVLVRSEC